MRILPTYMSLVKELRTWNMTKRIKEKSKPSSFEVLEDTKTRKKYHFDKESIR